MVDLVGQHLSNYRLVRQLGQGGFGDVYLGEHTYLKSQAAIKVLYTALSDKHKASFLKEAHHLVGLRHFHIVRFLEFGFEGDFPFLIMEYAPNGTLRTQHPKGTRLPLEQIVHYVKQIASALDYAHQQRVIHRDVKPENMLLTTNGEVVLSDFGIAVVQRTTSSLSTQNPAGTPVYMAPEQIGGKPCTASDQYALGVLVYEWLCGDPPFRGSPLEVYSQHLYKTPSSLCDRVPSLPPAVEDAVFGALAKDPQARFVSVQEFAEVLEEVWHTTQSPSLDVFVAPPSREQSFHPVPTSVPAPEEQKRSMADVPRPSVWNIPYPRNPFFTGRDNLLAQLTAAVQKAPAALTQPHAISGLGGIGMTQVAVEYAYRSHADYQAVLWVRADTRENIVSDFVTIAGLLELPEKDEQDQLIAVQAVKKWLRTHAKWLLIFDNADELVMLREFLPPMPGGHLLLTTRAQAMGRLAQRVEVEKLEVEVGALFLLRRAALLAPDATLEQVLLSDREAAIELTREMDGLPLALDQAGAYIEETSCRVGDYLRLYRQQRGALLARRGGLVADHPASVSSTWSLSFEQVEQRNRAAADLLRVCAFLHPDAIPEALLAEGAIHLGPQLAVFATDELAFNEAISALHAYSLVRRDLADKTLSLHRLVQAVLKDAMSEETQQLWAERVVRAVDAAFPEVEFSTWQRCQACLPHALACVTHLE